MVRIQPDEGIEISFAAKVPGQAFRVRTVALDFSYLQTFDEKSPEAYERVLHDALVGDATLFIRGDEVDECWRIVQPLVDAFDAGELPVATYPAGSWGPPEADVLDRDVWRRVETTVSIPGEVRVVDHVPSSFAKLVTAVAPRSIALSGGGTARTCYELLATAADVDWRSVEIFFGDERWVPVQDPDSNEGMARLAFLDEVEPAAIHSMREAGPTIEEAADAYDALLRASPPIEVVHLGLGPDGHTCSLFPGSPSLDETERLALATGDDLHPHRRLTITFPAIARVADRGRDGGGFGQARSDGPAARRRGPAGRPRAGRAGGVAGGPGGSRARLACRSC